MIHLDMISTLAFAAVALFIGFALCRLVPLLARYNLPAPVVGGLAVAVVLAALGSGDHTPFTFDITLQTPLMSAFFTSIGFRVGAGLLRRGGRALVVFLLISTVVAGLQNVLGITLSRLLGQPDLFGVVCGSLTLAGGPATAMAFAEKFEQAGVQGAGVIALASAICGIVAAGLLSAPISTVLIERRSRRGTGRDVPNPDVTQSDEPKLAAANLAKATPWQAPAYVMQKSVAVLLVAMVIGATLSDWLAQYFTFPLYIGAMITAAAIRNVDDLTGWFRLPHAMLDLLGDVALSLFLAMALMTLQIWKLADIAVPMAVILACQIAAMVLISAWPVSKIMGGDYDAAVTAGGFFGFMIGITANAMAGMDSVVKRYGPAPTSYLVVPVVGAFFIDF